MRAFRWPLARTGCTTPPIRRPRAPALWGGNVAENSGGPHCLKYGVTSRYVSGLTVVLPDGSLMELGGLGTATDLDLIGLFVGSEGCFGIATEIEVRLLPLTESVRTLLAIFDRVEDAGQAVTDIMAQGLLPAALEIIDGATIRAVEASVFAAGYPTDAGAALVIEFDGVAAGLESEASIASDACTRAGAREVRVAESDEERAGLWKGRKKAFGAMGRIAPDLLVQDATVPRTQLPKVLANIEAIAKRYRLNVANVFHAGDGNLHPNILFDRRDADELERVEKASKEIMQLCVDAGGTITGEHGVGLDKRPYMSLIHSSTTLEAMADVKEAFDPDWRCNPGKVLPDEVQRTPRAGRAGNGISSHGPSPAAVAGNGGRVVSSQTFSSGRAHGPRRSGRGASGSRQVGTTGASSGRRGVAPRLGIGGEDARPATPSNQPARLQPDRGVRTGRSYNDGGRRSHTEPNRRADPAQQAVASPRSSVPSRGHHRCDGSDRLGRRA